MATDKKLLTAIIWILFLGGLFGLAMGLQKTFAGAAPAEYGVMGIGGGLWLLSSAVAIYIRNKI